MGVDATPKRRLATGSNACRPPEISGQRSRSSRIDHPRSGRRRHGQGSVTPSVHIRPAVPKRTISPHTRW